MTPNALTVNTDKIFVTPLVADDDEYSYADTDETIMPEGILHFLLSVRLTSTLLAFFAKRKEVAIFGNVMFYYDQENRDKVVSPDLMICLDLAETPTRVYRLWKQQSVPTFVLELASKATWFKDISSKVALYQKLGVKEYFVFDAEYENLPVPLVAFRLVDGVLVEQEVSDGRIYSEILGLELVDTGKTLRFFNPVTGEFLLIQEEVQAENERLKAELAELRKQNGK